MAGSRQQQPATDRGFSLLLADQMCFALCTASRAVTALYRTLLDELGLTYPQYLVMLVLWERGASPIKDLASALHTDYGTLSPLLKRLEVAGFLRRQRRSDDERSVEIVLTDVGTALRHQAEGIPSVIGDAMGLDQKTFATLGAALRQLTASVTAHTANLTAASRMRQKEDGAGERDEHRRARRAQRSPA